MKIPRFIALLAALCAGVAPALATVPLTNLVDEQTPLIISYHDVPALVKNWKQSPWAKTWNDEQMKKFLAPLRAEMKVDEWDEATKRETGYTVEELFALATGDALIALKNLDFTGEPQPPDAAPLLVAIELGENTAKLEKIIADSATKDGNAPITTEDFSGVPLHSQAFSMKPDETRVMVWAFAEGVVFFSPSKDVVMAAIDALKNGGVHNAFGQSERFVRAQQQTGEAQIRVFANLQAIVPAIRKTIAARAGAGPDGQAPGFDPGPLLDALGLDALESLYFTVNIGETSTALNGGLTYTDVRGLIKLLAYRDGPTVQPAFVSPKWLSVTSAQFSLRDAYSALEEILETFNPVVAGMFQGQIKSFNQQLGIDLKRDLIGSLGDTLITATAMPPGASEQTPASLAELQQLYAISLQNVPAFTGAIEALKRLSGPEPDKLFKKREYLGAVINTYAPPGAERMPGRSSLSYAITSQYVLIGIGSPAMIETALQGMGGKQPSLWDKPEVKAALADIPATASTFQFQDTRALIAGVLKTIAQAAPKAQENAAAAENDEEEGRPRAKQALPFDFSAKPDPEAIAKYWGFSLGYGYRDRHGLYFRSQLNYSK